MSESKRRQAGLLVHPTSLPGRFGIGDIGPGAVEFVKWAASAGQRIWQILPLNPTGFGHSPYGALSAFAGNPLLISPERLVDDGLAEQSDLDMPASMNEGRVHYGDVTRWKETLLRKAWSKFAEHPHSNLQHRFHEFRNDPAQHYWLEDFALFLALKERFGGVEWPEWDEALARREKKAMAAAKRELKGEIEFHCFVQFVFFRQWWQLRHEAWSHGITIMGDLPIYVAYDAADVWSHRDLFLLDEQNRPIEVAGVPPDYFSATGQRWGNPLYRWDRVAERGYDWWLERIGANLRMTDLVRLDHFRGFAGYWAIPASEETAVNGRWAHGPGAGLFDAIRARFGSLPLIAEDLGTITADVDQLRHSLGIPGMKVLQFGFGDDDNIHLPHHHTVDTVAYTGTHDNDTTRGWYETAGDDQQRRVSDYFGECSADISWRMIRAAYGSVAETAIVPLQDVFSLGSEARMNTPGDSEGNWGWRATSDLFEKKDVTQRLRRLAEVTGRSGHR